MFIVTLFIIAIHICPKNGKIVNNNKYIALNPFYIHLVKYYSWLLKKKWTTHTYKQEHKLTTKL